MSEPSHPPPVVRGETAPAAPRRAGLSRWAAMGARAERLRWRVVARSRRPLRIRAPVTPILILLSPLIFLALGIGIFLPGRLRVHPVTMMLAVGQMLSVFSGDDEPDRDRLA